MRICWGADSYLEQFRGSALSKPRIAPRFRRLKKYSPNEALNEVRPKIPGGHLLLLLAWALRAKVQNILLKTAQRTHYHRWHDRNWSSNSPRRNASRNRGGGARGSRGYLRLARRPGQDSLFCQLIDAQQSRVCLTTWLGLADRRYSKVQARSAPRSPRHACAGYLAVRVNAHVQATTVGAPAVGLPHCAAADKGNPEIDAARIKTRGHDKCLKER